MLTRPFWSARNPYRSTLVRVADHPFPDRIEVDGGHRVLITWEDGEQMEFSARGLRDACPCAGCREDRNVGKVRDRLLDISIADASLVGNYAVNFVFSPDTHSTGIFPFTMLRALGERPVSD